MFKLVTNCDHWHNLYESRDSHDDFRTARAGDRDQSRFPKSILVTSRDKIEDRQFVVILVADQNAKLWSLEAIIRTRLGSQIEDLVSGNSAARRDAISELMEIAKCLDVVSERSEEGGRGAGLRKGWMLGFVLVFGGISFVSIALSWQAGVEIDRLLELGTEGERRLGDLDARYARLSADVIELQDWEQGSSSTGELMRRENERLQRAIGSATAELRAEIEGVRVDMESLREDVVRKVTEEGVGVKEATTEGEGTAGAGVLQKSNDDLPSAIRGVASGLLGEGKSELPGIEVADTENETSGTEDWIATTPRASADSIVDVIDEGPIDVTEQISVAARDPADAEDMTVRPSDPTVPPQNGNQEPEEGGKGESSETALRFDNCEVNPDAQVQKIQEFLMEQGYNLIGGADGKWGKHTEEIFWQWTEQVNHCRPPAGQLTPEAAYRCICSEPISAN